LDRSLHQETLNGKTPSEACGITIEGKNKVDNSNSECKEPENVKDVKRVDFI